MGKEREDEAEVFLLYRHILGILWAQQIWNDEKSKVGRMLFFHLISSLSPTALLLQL